MKLSYLCLAIVVALIATTAFADQAQFKAKFAELFPAEIGAQLADELADAKACNFPVSLSSFEGADWKGTDPIDPNHFSYTLSFCAASKDAVCGGKPAEGSRKIGYGSLCQYDDSRGGIFVDGLASFVAEPAPVFNYNDKDKKDKGFNLTFKNGEKCSGFLPKDRVVTMKFTCDSTKKDRKFTIMEPDECNYVVEIPTKFACPGGGSDGISGGAIFLIIVFSAAAVYVIAGCIICVVKFGKPIGLEACPHKTFWFALPALYIAGIKFTFGKIAGCFGSKTITSSTGEYETV